MLYVVAFVVPDVEVMLGNLGPHGADQSPSRRLGKRLPSMMNAPPPS
jgi:hypothetical protein